MKKIISLFLTITMLLPLLGINAAAADSKIKASLTYGGGYTYVKLSTGADKLYYTTDGTKPDRTDKLYAGKIKVTKPCTLRITAYNGSKAVNSVKISVNVRLRKPTIAQLDSSIDGKLCFKITAKSGSIYYTTDGTTPSKTNGKLVPSSGIIYTDSTSSVKAIAVKSGWKKSKVVSLKPVIPATGTETDEFAAEVVRLVNEERAAYGLPALKIDKTLSKAAQQRADEQLIKYGHTRPDGSKCSTIMGEYGMSFAFFGENVAAGYATPKEVVDGWMHSEGHRANILSSDYEYIGIGYAKKSGTAYTHYWAQLFWTDF